MNTFRSVDDSNDDEVGIYSNMFGQNVHHISTADDMSKQNQDEEETGHFMRR